MKAVVHKGLFEHGNTLVLTLCGIVVEWHRCVGKKITCKNCLKSKKKVRSGTLISAPLPRENLRKENRRLKAMVSLLQRKIEHGCSDCSCKLCDGFHKGDDEWELTT